VPVGVAENPITVRPGTHSSRSLLDHPFSAAARSQQVLHRHPRGTEMKKGGHFAAMEQPERPAHEIRESSFGHIAISARRSDAVPRLRSRRRRRRPADCRRNTRHAVAGLSKAGGGFIRLATLGTRFSERGVIGAQA